MSSGNKTMQIYKNRLSSHGKTPRPYSSPKGLCGDKTTGSDEEKKEEKDIPAPSKKSKTNATDANQNRENMRDDPAATDRKSLLEDFFSPMKRSNSTDDLPVLVSNEVAPDLESISPLVEDKEIHRVTNLWTEKTWSHANPSKESVQHHQDRARIWDEKETSTAHALLRYREEQMLGITPLPAKGTHRTHVAYGTKSYDRRNSWKAEDISVLEHSLRADDRTKVLDLAKQIVKKQKKVNHLDFFLNACHRALTEDNIPEADIETIVGALVHTMRVQFRGNKGVACKVLKICLEAWETIMDSDEAELVVMKTALYVLRHFPDSIDTETRAVAAISDIASASFMPGIGHKKFSAFCAEGGVEALMKATKTQHPRLQRKAEKVLGEIFDQAFDVVERLKEDTDEMDLDDEEEEIFLVHCNLAVHRLEESFSFF